MFSNKIRLNYFYFRYLSN